MFGEYFVLDFTFLCVFIGLCFSIYLLYINKFRDIGDYFFYPSIGIFVPLLFSMIISCIACAMFANASWSDSYVKGHYEALSAKTAHRGQGEMSGGFIYFSGKYEDIDYYYVHTLYSNGLMKLDKYRIDQTYINQSDSEKPKISFAYRKLEFKRPYFRMGDQEEFSSYILTVPKNSIVQRYDLNIGDK